MEAIQKSAYPFLQGGGEMGELIRSYDWSKTSLGTPGLWPKALQISLATVLNSGFPMFIFWGENLLCFYNDAYRPSLGDTGKHSAIGKKAKEVWSEIWEFIGPLITDVLNTGNPVLFEDQYLPIFRNGQMEDVYWTFSYSLLVNDDGLPGGVLVTCMETTKAVVSHQRLQESELRYRTLFKTMDQGFCVIEMIFNEEGKPVDYRFLEINPVFEKQTGLKDVEGRTVRELVPAHETHWFEIYGKVARTGEPVHFTERSAALGRWYEVSAFRVGDTTSNKVAVLFSDVSEQKKADEAIRQSEQNLRNIILQSPVAMCILKGPGFIVEIANDRMYELWGRGPEHLLHQPLFVGLPEVAKQGYEELLTAVYTTGKTYSTNGTPVTVPRETGIETVYLDLLYEAFRDANGVISGIMAVATDVTEQTLSRLEIERMVEQRTKELAEANEALQQMNKELQRSNANLEEFAYAASHDLKEPIRKVHFFTTQAKDQLASHLDENTAKAFGRIENATLRMGNLIDDLLLYSHVSQRPHETEAIDLNQKLQRVLEDLELDIEEKKAIFQIGPLPVVAGYRRQLQQLFQNLISNALKYSKARVTPRIHITGEPFEKNGRQYHLIKVTDNGIGFPQQYADKIFQMFTRLHGKDEYSGTGVGLSIVKKVVENHHGMIEVESEPGRGSTFLVYLPA